MFLKVCSCIAKLTIGNTRTAAIKASILLSSHDTQLAYKIKRRNNKISVVIENRIENIVLYMHWAMMIVIFTNIFELTPKCNSPIDSYLNLSLLMTMEIA